MKNIDHLFHFAKDLESIKLIISEGLKPSYAKERLAGRNIMVSMISFSNILLRDAGIEEVIFYGQYAISFTREWGIQNNLNPVIYTYDNGLLNTALSKILYSTLFLKTLQTYKDYFKESTERNDKPFSQIIRLSNTPKEVMDILDYLSVHYNEELLEILSNHAKLIYDTNFPILTVTKPYKVRSSKDEEFIAYNDREWRKLFSQTKILFSPDDEYPGDEEYEEWNNQAKPHFHEEEFRLRFNLSDIKAILVTTDEEVEELKEFLKITFSNEVIDNLINDNSLIIGTKDVLIENEF